MRVFIIGVLALAVCAPLAFGQDTVPLDQSIRDRKIEATVTGIGGSTGDTILITVWRKAPDVLRLTLTPGTMFTSVSGNVQNMAGASIKGERVGENSYRPASEIVLADDGQHSYVIEAYCLDFHKQNPGRSDTFSVTGVDEQAGRLLTAGKNGSAPISAIQAALWMHREGLSPAEVQSRFAVTPTQIEIANSLIRDSREPQPRLRLPDAGRKVAVAPPQNTTPGPRALANAPDGVQFPPRAIGGWVRVPGIVGGKMQDGAAAARAPRVVNGLPANDGRPVPESRGSMSAGNQDRGTRSFPPRCRAGKPGGRVAAKQQGVGRYRQEPLVHAGSDCRGPDDAQWQQVFRPQRQCDQ